MTSMPTEAHDVDTCYTLTLHDTYGDGWNGAYWSWINDYNGAVLRSGTVYNGYDQDEEICTYANSECYTLKTVGVWVCGWGGGGVRGWRGVRGWVWGWGVWAGGLR